MKFKIKGFAFKVAAAIVAVGTFGVVGALKPLSSSMVFAGTDVYNRSLETVRDEFEKILQEFALLKSYASQASGGGYNSLAEMYGWGIRNILLDQWKYSEYYGLLKSLGERVRLFIRGITYARSDFDNPVISSTWKDFGVGPHYIDRDVYDFVFEQEPYDKDKSINYISRIEQLIRLLEPISEMWRYMVNNDFNKNIYEEKVRKEDRDIFDDLMFAHRQLTDLLDNKDKVKVRSVLKASELKLDAAGGKCLSIPVDDLIKYYNEFAKDINRFKSALMLKVSSMYQNPSAMGSVDEKFLKRWLVDNGYYNANAVNTVEPILRRAVNEAKSILEPFDRAYREGIPVSERAKSEFVTGPNKHIHGTRLRGIRNILSEFPIDRSFELAREIDDIIATIDRIDGNRDAIAVYRPGLISAPVKEESVPASMEETPRPQQESIPASVPGISAPVKESTPEESTPAPVEETPKQESTPTTDEGMDEDEALIDEMDSLNQEQKSQEDDDLVEYVDEEDAIEDIEKAKKEVKSVSIREIYRSSNRLNQETMMLKNLLHNFKVPIVIIIKAANFLAKKGFPVISRELKDALKSIRKLSDGSDLPSLYEALKNVEKYIMVYAQALSDKYKKLDKRSKEAGWIRELLEIIEGLWARYYLDAEDKEFYEIKTKEKEKKNGTFEVMCRRYVDFIDADTKKRVKLIKEFFGRSRTLAKINKKIIERIGELLEKVNKSNVKNARKKVKKKSEKRQKQMVKMRKTFGSSRRTSPRRGILSRRTSPSRNIQVRS